MIAKKLAYRIDEAMLLVVRLVEGLQCTLSNQMVYLMSRTLAKSCFTLLGY